MDWKDRLQRMSLIPLAGLIYFSFLCCTDNGRETARVARGADHTGGEPGATSGNAYLRVEPSDAFKAIRLHIAGLRLATRDGKQVKRVNVDQRYDLLDPAGELAKGPLAQLAPLDRKDYARVSLLLGPGPHTVTPAGGAEQPLVIPPQFKDGIPVTLAEGDLPGQDRYELNLVFDAARSIQRSGPGDRAGDHDSFTLRPKLWGTTDRSRHGQVSGSLTDVAGRGLEGHTVTAQLHAQAKDEPATEVVRSARTSRDGLYTLDLLPLSQGQVYHAVPLPAAGERFFRLTATGPLRLGKDAHTWKPVTEAIQGKGILEGTIRTRAEAADYDRVDVLRGSPLDAPARVRTQFVVASALARQCQPGGQGRFAFALPPGRYLVRATRYTLNDKGEAIEGPKSFQKVQVRDQETVAMAVNFHEREPMANPPAGPHPQPPERKR